MNDISELPNDVVDAIHAGKKIEAIKRLREYNGLGLKEAKQIVDAYSREHPDLIVQRQSNGSFTIAIVLTILIIAGYFFLA